MAETQRFFIVRLERGLPAYRVVGLSHAIMQHPGVEAVFSTDIAGLSPQQLSLLTGEPLLGETRAQPKAPAA